MFGVTISARGSSSSRSAWIASSRSSRSPLFATITGSTTRFSIRCRRTPAATVAMIGALESIPVLAASAPMSPSTASSCAAMTSTGISWTAVTPTVFCAVIAVSTLLP